MEPSMGNVDRDPRTTLLEPPVVVVVRPSLHDVIDNALDILMDLVLQLLADVDEEPDVRRVDVELAEVLELHLDGDLRELRQSHQVCLLGQQRRQCRTETVDDCTLRGDAAEGILGVRRPGWLGSDGNERHDASPP